MTNRYNIFFTLTRPADSPQSSMRTLLISILLLLLSGGASANEFMDCRKAVELPEFKPLIVTYSRGVVHSNDAIQNVNQMLESATGTGHDLPLIDVEPKAKEEIVSHFSDCLAVDSETYLLNDQLSDQGILLLQVNKIPEDSENPLDYAERVAAPGSITITTQLEVVGRGRFVLLYTDWMRHGMSATTYSILQISYNDVGEDRFKYYTLLDLTDNSVKLIGSRKVAALLDSKNAEVEFIEVRDEGTSTPSLVFEIAAKKRQPKRLRFQLNSQLDFTPSIIR